MTNLANPDQHIERVFNTIAANKDLTNPSSIDSLVNRSWQRCVHQHELSPENSFVPEIIEQTRLHEYQEAFDQTQDLAQNSIDKLYGLIADIGYTVLLTDNNGITLDCRYNPESENELKKQGLYTGTNWSEDIAGTNGIGTCVAEEKSIVVRNEDHFFPIMMGMTCTVSPIFDGKGKLLATLDASTLLPESHNQNKLISRLVEQSARKIEVLSFLREYKNHWIIRFSTYKDFSDNISVGILALNESGIIISANRHAYKLLCKKFGQTIHNRFFHEVFETKFSDIVDNFNKNTKQFNEILALETPASFFFDLLPPVQTKISSSMSAKREFFNQDKKPRSKKHPNLNALAGNDTQMQIIEKRVQQIINLDLNILLIGETGSGKEALAKAIHDESNRKDEAFIAINCAAIPESLIESELFGYSSGTFTGGLKKGMKGKVLQANGGTLFLDEIGDMPLHLQTRLLRVLSEMEVIPLGETTPTYLDIQLISATNKSITEMVENSTFRKDLYYRLNGITLDIPSLRARSDKKELIVDVFAKYSSLKPIEISEQALETLTNYQWPGNVRQLINVAKYATAMCSNGVILQEDLPKDVLTSQSNNIKDNLQLSEYEILINCLKINKWNITKVSKQLGICRATVYRKMTKYNIVAPNDA